MIRSKALEVNIADYHVEVEIDRKYAVLQEVMASYFGLQEGLTIFLKELSHPYKNWHFIVKEARIYSLDYFHLIQTHPSGPAAAQLYIDIYLRAIESTRGTDVCIDAVDNLMLFLLKIVKDAGDAFDRFIPVLDGAFQSIRRYDSPIFMLFLKSYYQLNRLGEAALKHAADQLIGLQHLNLLMIRFYQETFAYWAREEDPQQWFLKEAGEFKPDVDLDALFEPIANATFRRHNETLDAILLCEDIRTPDVLRGLLELPGFNQIVNAHREIPNRLSAIGKKNGRGDLYRLLFLFYQMNLAGLSIIHEEALRDINRALTWIIDNEKPWNIRTLMEKTFSILKARAAIFPATALSCVLNMGKGVYRTQDIDFINFFIDRVIDLGFQAPNIGGVGNDWQIQVNTAHLQNIRTWLELIELSPKRSTRLMSYLIIHISMCGVFIKDTDLFPRDITRFLNSGVEPVYNIAKQLARLFPVYFNDIGAEGKLRDISTQLDEINHRKDVLLHFLRKQCHVESSNRIINFMEAVLHFWQTRDSEPLRPFIPPNIFSEIKTTGPYVDGVHTAMQRLKERGLGQLQALLRMPDEGLQNVLTEYEDIEPVERQRVYLAVNFYKLLNQKYNIDFIELGHYMAQLKNEGFPGLEALESVLEISDSRDKLRGLLDVQEELKAIVLSDHTFEIREDIYKKRHFTIDIPSMYGSYHEMKFNALGLSFRLEALTNVLFEKLIRRIDLSLITRATFYHIYDLLLLFQRALALDGISSKEFERQLGMLSHALEARGFTFTQYLDIFRGFATAVKNIINDYFNNIHEENLDGIIERTPKDQILPKYLPADSTAEKERTQHRISEIFFRDLISLALGLRQLDLFLSRILNTLFHQSAKIPKDSLHSLLNYDPQRAVTSLVMPNERVDGIIYLGNKGLNMVKLHNFGFPVPPGFIVTSEVFRCREVIERYPPAEANFRDQVSRHIAILENYAGKKFGNARNPLLLSVRSGSSISQPGMMDTFLDVGMNEDIAAGLAVKTGNAWFAWDNYRRFLQCWGMSFDLQRDDFDAIISDFKARFGIPLKRGFSGEQMQQVALTYKELVRDAGILVPEDPFEQLVLTTMRVLQSWESTKAKTYRKIMGISDDWGTAVTIQQMVFGNVSRKSGSGVIFTHNPRWSGDTLRLWGDFTIENQGEDVVSGLVTTLPISVIQQETEMRDTDITLETHFPHIFSALEGFARDLVFKRGWSPQEMEFTFEGDAREDLYILQSRDMAIRERKKFMTFDHDDLGDRQPIGHGIGVSGGAMSGRLVFTLDEIDYWRKLEPQTALVLARSDTVPDDIREIHASDGLLTSRGGLTSHAAVVAHRLGRTGVVGCGNLICDEKKKLCRINDIVLSSGDYISINGQEGSVYQGLIKVQEV
ncbi:MAG: pyruvate, phosphate dikinase [Deltaproteobacteria bacterium]|nr:pyruvate, phosphate dikinase [Deltaproteobacteria bacterium]